MSTSKPTIEELEAILNAEEEVPIEILPNGEVRERDGSRPGQKVITMREDLGGEYAVTAASIRLELAVAQAMFPTAELRVSAYGTPTVKVPLQTSIDNMYIVEISFPDLYPHILPNIHVLAPQLHPSPHRYPENKICYLHPSMWIPGVHDLKFAIARAAKWLNKYEVFQSTQKWPGAGMAH